MKLKALLVDDEPHCLDTLRFDLKRSCEPLLEIVGEAKNVLEAMALLNKKKPDILFLDIDLPDMNGMDFLKSLGETDVKVVFTTAHSKYAIPAYKFKAEAFLLKPISAKELKEVVEQVHSEHVKKSSFLSNKLAITDLNGTTYLNYADIIACESNSNYCIIHLSDQTKMTVSKTLKHIESLLDSQIFYRVHQSYVININHIYKYLKTDGGVLEMTNRLTFPISKSYKDKVMSLLR